MKVSAIIVWSVMLLFSAAAMADSTYVDTAEIADTAQVADTVLFDGKTYLTHANPVTSDVDFEKKLHQNPTVGLFKSMVLPGWGQVGNKSYIKAAVFAGLDAWFIGAAIHYGNQASDFRSRYDVATDPTTRGQLYDLYLDRKDERNKFTWFAVIITFISMFDAYVDAHLSGYPVKTDGAELSVDVRPTADKGLMASISLDF